MSKNIKLENLLPSKANRNFTKPYKPKPKYTTVGPDKLAPKVVPKIQAIAVIKKEPVKTAVQVVPKEKPKKVNPLVLRKSNKALDDSISNYLLKQDIKKAISEVNSRDIQTIKNKLNRIRGDAPIPFTL